MHPITSQLILLIKRYRDRHVVLSPAKVFLPLVRWIYLINPKDLGSVPFCMLGYIMFGFVMASTCPDSRVKGSLWPGSAGRDT